MTSYKIRTTETPTLANEDMALGALAGTLLMGPVVGTAIGGVIGGMIGKNRMEREQRDGKIIGPPEKMNKRAWIGAMGGYIGTSLAVGVLMLGAAFTMSALSLTIAPAAVPLLYAGIVAATVVVPLAGAVAGYKSGSRKGYEKQAREYEIAQQTGIPLDGPAPQLEPQRAQSLSRSRSTSVTPEEMEQLNARLRESQQGNHTGRLDQQRQQQAEETLARA